MHLLVKATMILSHTCELYAYSLMNLDILHRILSVDVPEDTIAHWSLRFPRSTTVTATGTLTSKYIFNVDETGSTVTRVLECTRYKKKSNTPVLFYGHSCLWPPSLRPRSFTSDLLLRPPFFYDHSYYPPTLIIRPPLLSDHPSFPNTLLFRSLVFSGHLSFPATFFFRHDRRTATKFGTHVRIDTGLALT